MLRTADGAFVLAAAPAEALAALVAVTARRCGSGLVVEVAEGAGGAGGRPPANYGVDLASDPPFAELCALVEPLLDGKDSITVGGARLVAGEGGTRLYAGADAAGLAGQVARALADAALAPRTPVSVLNLASAEDLETVARFGLGAPPAPARSVPDLVRARAACIPEAPAVTGGGLTLSYRQLVGRADALAGVLAVAGVGADEVVGVFAGRSPGLVVALLAVLNAGGAYLALSPQWPDARIAALLDDAKVRVVLTEPGVAGRVPAGYVIVPLDAQRPATEEPAITVALPAGISPDALAYVSYTSGSTGEPKGVCVPHRAVARLVDDPDWIALGPGDTVLQAAPIAFDASTFELWGALAAGARVALLPPGDVDPMVIGTALADEGVTVLWLTSGLFHQMVDSHLDRLAGIRQLLTGGDVVSPDAVRRVLAAYPELVLTNGYGPTENVTFTTCGTFYREVGDGPLPIGRPIRGTSVQVLDPVGRPVPPGVVGHLHALGAGLARGYLGRPAATAAAFMAAPNGDRWYRTGDLARWRADGMLDFIGRSDGQVKINGYRVEPGEVAAILCGHPEVAAAEVASEPGPGGAWLVAYIVPARTQAGLTQRELREWARARVPEFLVPAKVLTLDRFPLTGNGKLDRAELARLAAQQERAAEPGQAARTPLERYLCRLWAEVLMADEVGVDDDFFELGGHSLVAADLLARVEKELGVELSARTLYLSPTIAELATSDELRPLRDQAGVGNYPDCAQPPARDTVFE